MLDREQRDLLISLSYLYLACGQEIRALPLLWLLERDNGNDPEVLRALAHALTAECMCDQALKVIDRVEALEGAGGSGEVLLLRSRALHAAGQRAEARACFTAFVSRRARRLAAGSAVPGVTAP